MPYAGEAAVLYARVPGEPSGRILSLTFRYFPHVIGDGRLTLRELIAVDERAQWKAPCISAPTQATTADAANSTACRRRTKWCASR